LEVLGGQEATFGPLVAAFNRRLLLVDPVAEVGVGQALQVGPVELVVVDKRAEAVRVIVTDVPDERLVPEELIVLLGELAFPVPSRAHGPSPSNSRETH
jgi:hypothetical protein